MVLKGSKSLRDPVGGEPLRFKPVIDQSTGLLIGDGNVWPVVDRVPMLRVGRAELVAAAVAAIKNRQRRTALRLLLNDRDDFDRQPPASVADLDWVIDAVDTGRLGGEEPGLLHAALRRLRFGPVADYFAVRPSTPTFLSGLQLLAESAGDTHRLVDLAGGLGQLSGWFAAAARHAGENVELTCVDTVFSKAWLARWLYCRGGQAVCCDVSAGRCPVVIEGPATVLCHDAFYFLPDKPRFLRTAAAIAGDRGRVLLGHVHNGDHDPHGVGHAESVAAMAGHIAAAIPGQPVAWSDDESLIDGATGGRVVWHRDWPAVADCEAVAIVIGGRRRVEFDVFEVAGPVVDNPIVDGDRVRWPSPAMAAEYSRDDYLLDKGPGGRMRRLPRAFATVSRLSESSRCAHDSESRAAVWAIVGCGWVARDYGLPAILEHPRCRLGAVIDRDDAAIDRLFGGQGSDVVRANDFDAHRLAGIDAVYVATPNHAHAGVVTRLLAMGKHVLCEKPMAHDVAGAEAIAAAAAGSRARYATGFDQRHHPGHVSMAASINGGEIGTVTQIRIHYACWLPPGWTPDGRPHDNWRVDRSRSGGGATIDLAPHGVDLVAALTASPVVRIAAMLQNRVHGYEDNLDDGGVVTVQTASGVLASLHVSYACPDELPRRRIEVIGTAGTLTADDTMGQTAGGRVVRRDLAGDNHVVEFDQSLTPFAAQIAAFVDVLDRRRTPYWDVAAELEQHRMLLGAMTR